MSKVFSDFSQLSKSLFKKAPDQTDTKPAPAPVKSTDAEALAYFKRPTAKAPNAAASSPEKAQIDALKAEIAALKAANAAAATEATRLRNACETASAALEDAKKEIARLKGTCGQLQGDLRKAQASASEPREGVPGQQTDGSVGAPAPGKGLLAVPAGHAELFPGETRETVIASLAAAQQAAQQGGRERRAAILADVLRANPSSGELERRREKIKQIMKDSGYYTDPKELASLGIQLISGRTHWKLQYGDVRAPIAKTPSDFRASLNIAADLANRFF